MTTLDFLRHLTVSVALISGGFSLVVAIFYVRTWWKAPMPDRLLPQHVTLVALGHFALAIGVAMERLDRMGQGFYPSLWPSMIGEGLVLLSMISIWRFIHVRGTRMRERERVAYDVLYRVLERRAREMGEEKPDDGQE